MSKTLKEYQAKIDPTLFKEYTQIKQEIDQVKKVLNELYQYVNEMGLKIKENDAAHLQTRKQVTTIITDAELYTEAELDSQLAFIATEQERLKAENNNLIEKYKKILKQIEENESKINQLNQKITVIKK